MDKIKSGSDPSISLKMKEQLQSKINGYMSRRPEYEITSTIVDERQENSVMEQVNGNVVEEVLDSDDSSIDGIIENEIQDVVLIPDDENSKDKNVGSANNNEQTKSNEINSEIDQQKEEQKLQDNAQKIQKTTIETQNSDNKEKSSNNAIAETNEIESSQSESNVTFIPEPSEVEQEKTDIATVEPKKADSELDSAKDIIPSSFLNLVVDKQEQNKVEDEKQIKEDKQPIDVVVENNKAPDMEEKQEETVVQIIDDENSFFNDKNAMNELPVIEIVTDNKNDEILTNENDKKVEFATVITEEEEKEEAKDRTSFLDRVKTALIRDSGNKQVVMDEGNSEPKTIFSRLKEQVIPKKPSLPTSSVLDLSPVQRKKKKDDIVLNNNEYSTGIIDEIANRIKKVEIIDKIDNVKDSFTEKFNEIIEKNKSGKVKMILSPREKIRLEQRMIREIILENEVEQALQNKNEIISSDNKIIDETYKYVEDNEDYQNFLNEKEIKNLVEKEKITIPNVLPKKKNFISYEVNKHPDELIEPRSRNNAHIPPLEMMHKREKLIITLIEYGMTKDFATIVNDLGDSNYILTSQYTLLTYSTKNKQYDIMKYLIQSGANINKRDDRYETPIMLATKNNDLEGVRILINAGADLNQIDLLKRTPLIYAIERNFEKIALLLIEGGADVNIPNSVGEGTLSIATRLNRNNIKQKIMDAIEKQKKKMIK
ncbi:MAG: ankyrin repeat domain-containing protein [Rickettsiales bacterium]|nr:ankyrin repeat domain-containing protein [Rickettsiales bacterium]